jgi:hypothetical protein
MELLTHKKMLISLWLHKVSVDFLFALFYFRQRRLKCLQIYRSIGLKGKDNETKFIVALASGKYEKEAR